MVILIAGASHTGKTLLAQQLLEQYHYPYLSIDHLKMGLIRSAQTDLTVCDDDKLTDYLWPILQEIVKTAIENKQNLIVEGCYIPFHWRENFDEMYLSHICCRWLVMTRNYIEHHFGKICSHANVVENRLDDSWLNPEQLIRENEHNLEQCRKFGCEYILIDEDYQVNFPVSGQ